MNKKNSRFFQGFFGRYAGFVWIPGPLGKVFQPGANGESLSPRLLDDRTTEPGYDEPPANSF